MHHTDLNLSFSFSCLTTRSENDIFFNHKTTVKLHTFYICTKCLQKYMFRALLFNNKEQAISLTFMAKETNNLLTRGLLEDEEIKRKL